MSLAIAPAVWTLHFLAVYALVSVACRIDAASLVRPGAVLATLAALAAYAWLAYVGAERVGGETQAFMARTNRLLALLSTVGTLWVAYPVFSLPPCAS